MCGRLDSSFRSILQEFNRKGLVSGRSDSVATAIPEKDALRTNSFLDGPKMSCSFSFRSVNIGTINELVPSYAELEQILVVMDKDEILIGVGDLLPQVFEDGFQFAEWSVW